MMGGGFAHGDFEDKRVGQTTDGTDDIRTLSGTGRATVTDDREFSFWVGYSQISFSTNGLKMV